MRKFEVINEDLYFVTSGKVVVVPPELERNLETIAEEFLGESSMQVPAKPELPFFAYGLFKPGQLGFERIRDHVSEIFRPICVAGALFERDGVPLFHETPASGSIEVCGVLLRFSPSETIEAYRKVADVEPERLYKWEARLTTDGVEANLLVARSIHGAKHIEGLNWDGKKDPLFHEALSLVESILVKNGSESKVPEIERLFQLQMAYMLLWTSIERYTSLRYHLRKKVMFKIKHMAKEEAFRDTLKKYVKREDKVYSTEGLTPKRLCGDKPDDALWTCPHF